MSDQVDIVKCCICKEPKDVDDTDQCEVCWQYVCHWCGCTEKHECTGSNTRSEFDEEE